MKETEAGMANELKMAAARAALEYVKDGMKLGIGTGSTADAFIQLLAGKVDEGMTIIGVPTSQKTADLCGKLGVPLTTLDETPWLDLTIDGADEIDSSLRLIKGGGGALLREKIVACASNSMLVIADDSKLVETLGAFDLPIEVNRFGMTATRMAVEKIAEKLGLTGGIELRQSEESEFVTDEGHLIFDACFGRIPDPEALSEALLQVPGVVEHGLFLGIAKTAILAGNNGIQTLSAD